MAEQYIHGLDEVEAKLELLSNGKAAKRAATRSARKVMAVVRAAAIAQAKQLDDLESPERIWKNIVVKAGRISGNDVMMKVGIRGGAKSYVKSKDNVRKGLAGKKYKTDGDKQNPGGDTFYWRFLEFGTQNMIARPFMRPSLQNNVNAITNNFAGIFSTEIDKELAKL